MSNTRSRARRARHQPQALSRIPEQSTVRVGAPNLYHCPLGHITVTIDRDAGVTPSGMPCPHEERRGFPATTVVCGLRAASSWYRLPMPAPPVDDLVTHFAALATHEWHRPGDDERRQLDAWQADHVNRGGLLLRLIAQGVSRGA